MSFTSSAARLKGSFKRFALAAGLAMGMQGAAFAGPPPPANPYYVYGIDGTGKIQELKLQNQASGGPEIQYQKVVLDTKLTGLAASFNGLSYDIGRDDLFFAYANQVTSNQTDLYWWDKQSQSVQNVGSFSDAGGIPTSAAYYNDAVWFFQNREVNGSQTVKLGKIALNYSGGVPAASAPVFFDVSIADPVGACTAGFTVGTGSCATRQVFGDIAIDSSGKLYAATANNSATFTESVFYTVDLGTCSGSICSDAVNLAASGVFGYQLSFGYAGSSIDDTTLVGTKTTNGELGLVDLSTGAFTAYNGSAQLTNPSTDGNSLLRDLAGPATNPYDAPGPLPLLGAGAAFGWSRRLRQRIGKSPRV